MKQCTKCQENKPLEEFYLNRFGRDGRQPHCKDCLKSQANDWRKRCPEDFKKAKKKWDTANKDKRREWKRAWDKKMMNDPLHRLNNNLRGNMYHALKAVKGFRKWESLVGYTLDELVKHLESKFTAGISWDNYGTEWHVDHITPKSWFAYTSTDDPSFRECWALSNLQPKLRLDNIRKGNRFIG